MFTLPHREVEKVASARNKNIVFLYLKVGDVARKRIVVVESAANALLFLPQHESSPLRQLGMSDLFLLPKDGLGGLFEAARVDVDLAVVGRVGQAVVIPALRRHFRHQRFGLNRVDGKFDAKFAPTFLVHVIFCKILKDALEFNDLATQSVNVHSLNSHEIAPETRERRVD